MKNFGLAIPFTVSFLDDISNAREEVQLHV